MKELSNTLCDVDAAAYYKTPYMRPEPPIQVSKIVRMCAHVRVTCELTARQHEVPASICRLLLLVVVLSAC